MTLLRGCINLQAGANRPVARVIAFAPLTPYQPAPGSAAGESKKIRENELSRPASSLQQSKINYHKS
jgi:hypothetical protein